MIGTTEKPRRKLLGFKRRFLLADAHSLKRS
nr:MAG TPA: hypothetical protein [Caudoviricetes sp.]